MTDWVDEILTPLDTEGERARGARGRKKEGKRAQDDRLKNSLDGIFRANTQICPCK
jgi:hypothetical protein